MVSRFHRPNLFWPLILIGLGLILLLQTLDLLPPGLWPALVSLWPALLIVLGLDMLIGRASWRRALLVPALGVLVVAAVLAASAVRANLAPAAMPQALSQPLLDAQTAQINLDVSAAELNLSALAQPSNLMEGEAVLGAGQSVEQHYSSLAGEGQLDLAQRQDMRLMPFVAWRNAGSARWDVQLTSAIPLGLGVHTGLGRAHLDLAELKLLRLNLQTGLGPTFVIFPPRGSLRATVSTGLGAVVLTIPVDLPTRLTVSPGLVAVQIPSRFARAGQVYTANNYGAGSGDYLDLTLNAGLGSVTIN
jgi:hypothetical protein